MKIFSAEQLYEADKITIEKNSIKSADLMEHAATQVFNWMHQRMQGSQVPIRIFCGVGNNGGDGLVLGRHLLQHGYAVEVYIVNFSDKRSEDFLLNLERIKEFKYWPKLMTCKEDFPELDSNEIVVDAIFGIGLNRPPIDWVKELIQHINTANAYTISVDIPSGMYANTASEDLDAIVACSIALSFQTPKLSFFLPETGKYLQAWEALNIGLDPEFLLAQEVEAQLIGKPEVLPMYLPREKYAHKGDYGHSLIIGGSYGKMGAVTLASSACLRTGAGLVSTYVPNSGVEILQIGLPEAMVITDNGRLQIADIDFDIEPTVIGVGVGMGTHEQTKKAFELFLTSNKTPLVVDADALNLLAEDKNLLKLLPQKAILTPHPKELERLIGKWKNDFDKLEKVKKFAKKYDLIVVIKGANTIVVHDEKLYVNTTGNPGMATAGSGDVLLGVITGLVSQGYDALQATVFGVYLHGRAGDIAISQTGYQGLLASDIIKNIGAAYIDLFAREEPLPNQEDQEA